MRISATAFSAKTAFGCIFRSYPKLVIFYFIVMSAKDMGPFSRIFYCGKPACVAHWISQTGGHEVGTHRSKNNRSTQGCRGKATANPPSSTDPDDRRSCRAA